MTTLPLRLAILGAALVFAASPAAAASCNGASHELTLTNGTANPGSGPPGTVVTFSVRYTDSAGCVPSLVTVSVAGMGTSRLVASGTSYQQGVIFSVALAVPPGSHAYTFRATSGEGRGEKTVTLSSVSPQAVVISAPTQPPTAAPPPPPPPPAPTVVQPLPDPVVPPPPATATTKPTSTESESSATPGSAGSPSTGPTEVAASLDATGGLVGKRPAGLARVQAPSAAPAAATLERSGLPVIVPGWLVAYASSTAAGLALFFVLAQRRMGPRTEVAAAVPESPAAATDTAPVPKVSAPRLRDLVPPPDPDLLSDPDGPVGPNPEEVGVPRWLRTSLREARLGPNELRRRDWQ